MWAKSGYLDGGVRNPGTLRREQPAYSVFSLIIRSGCQLLITFSRSGKLRSARDTCEDVCFCVKSACSSALSVFRFALLVFLCAIVAPDRKKAEVVRFYCRADTGNDAKATSCPLLQVCEQAEERGPMPEPDWWVKSTFISLPHATPIQVSRPFRRIKHLRSCGPLSRGRWELCARSARFAIAGQCCGRWNSSCPSRRPPDQLVQHFADGTPIGHHRLHALSYYLAEPFVVFLARHIGHLLLALLASPVALTEAMPRKVL